MGVYFCLVAAITILPLLLSPIRNSDRRNKAVLFLSLILIFLLMALKAPSVGRDTAGYKRIYEAMVYQPWSDYDISWMEWGYEFLMMVFTHIFHASFQMFMTCIYAFVYYSYYCFFKRYSEDFTTTVILYICFTFLTFDMSAVRTMIGVAICLYAVPYAEKSGILNLARFALITFVAAQIHKSAYIFFAVYFVIKVKITFATAILYFGIPAILFLFKSQFYMIINLYFKSVQESAISIGGNLLVYIISIVLTLFVWVYYKRRNRLIENDSNNDKAQIELSAYFENSGLAMRMIYVGIVLQIFASGTVLTRMAQYVQFFILVLIPNNINRLDVKSRAVVKFILYALVIAYFTKYTLLANALDIVPYRFFWSEI